VLALLYYSTMALVQRSVATIFVFVATLALGQTPTPEKNYYDTVSIKRGAPGPTICGFHPSPGQLRLDNCSLPGLVAGAYGVRQDRILGLPLWTSSETYNFVAKSVGPATIPEQWQMLGLVLEDRFKLKSHRETRQMPVYDLSAQASGIKFPEAVPGGCTPRDVNAAPPTTPEEARKRAENMCGTGNALRLPEGGLRFTAKAFTMAQLARNLQQYVDRPVADHTGSAKLFDIDFTFDGRSLGQNNSEVQGTGGGKKTPVDTGDASDLPNIVAVLKKAGLTLTSGRGGVEVMVIDRLERPSEN